MDLTKRKLPDIDLSQMRWAVHAAVAVFWIVAVVFFVGVGFDHVADVRLLQRAYENWLPTGDFDAPGNDYTQFHSQAVVDSYGYSFQYLSHLFTRAVSAVVGDEYGINSQVRIVSQNLLIASFGFLGCFVVGRIVRVLTDSARAELAGFAAMALTPVWVGHSWMNQKDLPFATGFAACTLVGVLALDRTFSRRTGRPAVVGPTEEAFYLVVGVVFTFGTRPGVAALAVPLLALLFMARRGLQRPSNERLMALAIGVVITLATNPASVPNPIGWVWSAIRTGRDFPGWNGQVFFFGEFVDGADFGARELFIEYFFQMPLLLVVGLVVALVAVVRRRGRIPVAFTPIAYLSVLVPLVVFSSSRVNYNAGRQYLFIVPGVVVVGVLGLRHLLRNVHGGRGEIARLVLVVLGLSLLFDHLSIFPYQHVYRNETFRLVPDYPERFEYDYWGLVGRELADGLADLGPGAVYLGAGGLPDTGGRYVDSRTTTEPFLADDQRAISEFSGSFVGGGWWYYWPPAFANPFLSDLGECRPVREYSLLLWPERIPLTTVYDCR